MIYDKLGQVAVVKDGEAEIIYTIGDYIIATNQSEYYGLYGRIMEIRDGEDKDTDNETPDIYCNFFCPTEVNDIFILEKRFERLYGHHVAVSRILLDDVIMAPSMIRKMEDNDGSET